MADDELTRLRALLARRPLCWSVEDYQEVMRVLPALLDRVERAEQGITAASDALLDKVRRHARLVRIGEREDAMRALPTRVLVSVLARLEAAEAERDQLRAEVERLTASEELAWHQPALCCGDCNRSHPHGCLVPLQRVVTDLLYPPKGRGKKAAFKRFMTRKTAHELITSEPPVIPVAVEGD